MKTPSLDEFLDSAVDWIAWRPGGSTLGGTYPGPPGLSAGRQQDPSVRKLALGMAGDDHYVEQSFVGGFFGPRWAEYSMYTEGKALGSLRFEIWRSVLFHTSTQAVLECIDRPVRSTSIHWGPAEPDPAAVAVLLRGRYLIGRATGRGRPPGLSDLSGLAEIRSAIAEERAAGRRPGQADVAAALNLAPVTLRRFLRSHGTSWRELLIT